jgi:hypothetical protein
MALRINIFLLYLYYIFLWLKWLKQKFLVFTRTYVTSETGYCNVEYFHYYTRTVGCSFNIRVYFAVVSVKTAKHISCPTWRNDYWHARGCRTLQYIQVGKADFRYSSDKAVTCSIRFLPPRSECIFQPLLQQFQSAVTSPLTTCLLKILLLKLSTVKFVSDVVLQWTKLYNYGLRPLFLGPVYTHFGNSICFHHQIQTIRFVEPVRNTAESRQRSRSKYLGYGAASVV